MIDEINIIDNKLKYNFWDTLKSIIKDKVKSTLEDCDTDTKLRIIKAYPKAIKYIKNEDRDFRLKATRILKDKIIEYIPKEGEKIGDEKIEDIIRTSLVSELPFLIERYKGKNIDVLFTAAKQNRTIMKNFIENKNGNWESLHIGYNKLNQDEKKEKWFELFEYYIDNYGKNKIWDGVNRIVDNEEIYGDITEMMKKYNGEYEEIRINLINHYNKEDERKIKEELLKLYIRRAHKIKKKYNGQENKIKKIFKKYDEIIYTYQYYIKKYLTEEEKDKVEQELRKKAEENGNSTH